MQVKLNVIIKYTDKFMGLVTFKYLTSVLHMSILVRYKSGKIKSTNVNYTVEWLLLAHCSDK